MNGFTYIGVGGGVLSILAGIMMTNIDIVINNSEFVSQSIFSAGAEYAAADKVDKTLYELKTSDIYSVKKVNEFVSDKKGYINNMNKGLETNYLNFNLNNSTSTKIDLGEILGSDLFFKGIKVEDYFDTFNLNFNKNTNEHLLVEVIRFNKFNSNINNCDFYDNLDKICTVGEKLVINTSDPNLNGKIDKGLSITYGKTNDDFINGLNLSGFNFTQYDYRISFNTISGKYTNVSYEATSNGKIVGLPNNFIDIDVTGNALDSYSRIRLTKNINTNIQPNVKYVLFSDSTIAK